MRLRLISTVFRTNFSRFHLRSLLQWIAASVRPQRTHPWTIWSKLVWKNCAVGIRRRHALRRPLIHTVFTYNIDAVLGDTARDVDHSREIVPSISDTVNSAFGGLLFVGRSRYNDIVVADETVSRVHCIIVRSVGTVGVFDGWSSYGTLTVERGQADRECEESAVDNRRPLLFDEGESFTLRVGKNATIKFPG